MIKFVIFIFCFTDVYGYFTLTGRCPDNVRLQENFRLADFYGKWYQAYHFSSDGQRINNCSISELMTRPSGIYLNQSRIDRGLFHRFSLSKLDIPTDIEGGSDLGVIFYNRNAPRRLQTRKYPFRVLATNYNYFATVYTCSYSPLIDKHFIYVWILSRSPVLNEVSKTLATKQLQQIGVDQGHLVKDDWSRCSPKYYTEDWVEPTTFRFPVPI